MNTRNPTPTLTAQLLAQQISAKLTEACLDWGQAINEAAAAEYSAKSKDIVELKVSLARMRGKEVANLSSAIAQILRP